MSDAVVDTFDMELTPPLIIRGVTYDALHLKEPRAKQVQDAEKKLDANLSEASVTEYQMELVRQVAGVDEAVIQALTVRQLGQAYNWLDPFIGNPYADIDDATEVPPDALDLPLDPPISWNNGSVASLPLREPTAEELRKARGFMRSANTPFTHRSYEIQLLIMVTGLNPAVINGLRIRDLTAASRHLALFIAAGRKTGKR